MSISPWRRRPIRTGRYGSFSSLKRTQSCLLFPFLLPGANHQFEHPNPPLFIVKRSQNRQKSGPERDAQGRLIGCTFHGTYIRSPSQQLRVDNRPGRSQIDESAFREHGLRRSHLGHFEWHVEHDHGLNRTFTSIFHVATPFSNASTCWQRGKGNPVPSRKSIRDECSRNEEVCVMKRDPVTRTRVSIVSGVTPVLRRRRILNACAFIQRSSFLESHFRLLRGHYVSTLLSQ